MIVVFYIILFIAIVCIDFFIARQFASVAEDKDYSGRMCFHMCFWFGIVGYLLVIALPDRGVDRTIAIEQPISTATTTPDPTPAIGVRSSIMNDKWICGYCKAENSMNYSQCKKCGKFRSV